MWFLWMVLGALVGAGGTWFYYEKVKQWLPEKG